MHTNRHVIGDVDIVFGFHVEYTNRRMCFVIFLMHEIHFSWYSQSYRKRASRLTSTKCHRAYHHHCLFLLGEKIRTNSWKFHTYCTLFRLCHYYWVNEQPIWMGIYYKQPKWMEIWREIRRIVMKKQKWTIAWDSQIVVSRRNFWMI